MTSLHNNVPPAPSGSLWDGMPPKTAFAFGLVSGIGALSIVGLIVLLSVFLRGGGMLAADTPRAPSAQAPTAQAPNAPPPAAAPTGAVTPVDPSIDHIRGNPDAEIFVIEYSDFECPFCKRHHPTMQQVVDDSDGKVAWVYRHFPLSFHENAAKEAEATECANELGGNDAFWAYTDKIFERTTSNGTGFPLSGLVPLAKELGLDEAAFKTCLDSGKYAQHVQQDMSEGAAAGVGGTPGNIVWTKDGRSQLVEGAVPLQTFKTVIDALVN